VGPAGSLRRTPRGYPVNPPFDSAVWGRFSTCGRFPTGPASAARPRVRSAGPGCPEHPSCCGCDLPLCGTGAFVCQPGRFPGFFMVPLVHGPPAPRTLPVPKLRTRSPSSPTARPRRAPCRSPSCGPGLRLRPRPARAAHPAGPQAADPVSIFAGGPPAPRTLPVPKLRTRSPSSPAAPQVMWVGEGLYAGVPRFEIARVDRSRHGDLALHRMESAPFPACSGEFPIESRNSMNLQ
jgi:hypothetical protein